MGMSSQVKWRTLLATGQYEFVAEMRRQGREEGRKTGQSESILRILENREIVVDAHIRGRITSCGDMETLDAWFDRALTITEISELFQGGRGCR